MTSKRTKTKAVLPTTKNVSATRRQSTALVSTGDFAALVERVVRVVNSLSRRASRR